MADREFEAGPMPNPKAWLQLAGFTLGVTRQIVWIAPMMALMGCATNALRIEYATDVAAKAELAAAASRQYLVEIDKARVAANLELVASDPACVPNAAYVRRQANLSAIRSLETPPRGWLCAAAPTPGVTYDDAISLAPLGADLEPTFVLIDAVGAYSAAITKIVDEKGPDPVQDLTDALALARSAEGLLQALAGGTPVVPAADDKRLAAVTGLIAFITELRTEQSKVERLRHFLANDNAEAGLIIALQNHLDGWETSRKSDENLRFVLASTLVGQAQRIDPPLPQVQRRAFAKAYYDSAAARIVSGRLKPALDGVLDEVAAADEDFRRVLAENPRLNSEEKKRVAEIARERMGRAFDALTRLVLSFKGE